MKTFFFKINYLQSIACFLLCFLCLTQVNAQTLLPYYYYADDLNESLGGSESGKAIAIKVQTYKTCTRAFFYDPKTQQTLAVMRGTALPCYGRKGTKSILPDSSFTLNIPKGNSYIFDAKTKTMTCFDDKKHKISSLVYLFEPKDTSAIATEYYTNGKVQSVNIKNHITAYNYILNQKDIRSYNNIQYYLQEVIASPKYHHIKYYYPNGQIQQIATNLITNKTEYYNSAPAFTLYDSTGLLLNKNIVFSADKKHIGADYSIFHKNGRLSWYMDYQKNNPHYISTTRFTDIGDTITSQEFKYNDTFPSDIMYIKEKADGFFRKKTNYDNRKIKFSYDANSIKTAFFNITKSLKKDILYISLNLQGYTWTPDACPIKPAFIIEGNYKGIIPDGEWRIYYPDSIGKKQSLAVTATFKNGLPDGKWVALDKQQDTLASVVYQNDLMRYNKFDAAYMQQHKPIIFLEDSLKKAQNRLNQRNFANIAQQHALHKLDARNIWQRDTLIYATVISDYDDFKYQNIVLIKERISADTNSLIRLKYFFPQYPKVPISVVLYQNKTQIVDSIATIYNTKSNLMARYNANKHSLLQFKFDEKDVFESQTDYLQPNDSTFITTNYYPKDSTHISNITIDSIGYTPKMKANFADYIHFNTNVYLRDFNIKINERIWEHRNISSNFNDCEANKISPIHTQSTTYFTLEGKKSYTIAGGKLD
jgi:hypothetical protein